MGPGSFALGRARVSSRLGCVGLPGSCPDFSQDQDGLGAGLQWEARCSEGLSHPVFGWARVLAQGGSRELGVKFFRFDWVLQAESQLGHLEHLDPSAF